MDVPQNFKWGNSEKKSAKQLSSQPSNMYSTSWIFFFIWTSTQHDGDIQSNESLNFRNRCYCSFRDAKFKSFSLGISFEAVLAASILDSINLSQEQAWKVIHAFLLKLVPICIYIACALDFLATINKSSESYFVWIQPMSLYECTRQAFLPVLLLIYLWAYALALIFFKNSFPDIYMVVQNLRNSWFSRKYRSEMQDIHDTQ
jgi:hypothetical protein